MAGPLNPTTLSWTQPEQNTDGSPFTADQFAGFEVSLNDQPAFVIPSGWDTDGMYEMPLALLALANGPYSLKMRTVNKLGVASDWTEAVSFVLSPIPKAPFGLRVG